jgi:hypothetical protein
LIASSSRGEDCQSVVGKAHFGVVTSKKGKFFGWRLHTTVSGNQVIDDWMVAPGSVPDPQAMEALVEDRRDLTLIGDKIYNDVGLEERLWRKKRILLLPLRKDNQKSQWPAGVQRRLGWLRHRVETVFQHLDDGLYCRATARTQFGWAFGAGCDLCAGTYVKLLYALTASQSRGEREQT